MDNKNTNYVYDLNALRGWQKSNLGLLKVFSENIVVSPSMISGASGSPIGSQQYGGKLTPLVRNELIVKAYKDDGGSFAWQLNEDKVNRSELKEFLNKIGI